MIKWIRGPGAVLGFGAWCVVSSALAQESPDALAQLIEASLREHPSLAAARAERDAARATAEAAAQPLYNPSLELDGERTDVDSYFAGISQTLDVYGRGAARRSAGEIAAQASDADYAAAVDDALGSMLRTLAEMHTAQALAGLAKERVALLERSRSVAEQRFSSGDIGQAELDLVEMEFAEAQAAAATAELDAASALGALRAATGVDRDTWPPLPAAAFDAAGDATANSPATLRAARLRADVARGNVKVTQLERRPEPTVGVRVGKDDEETLVGLSLSMPLPLRNSLRAEVRAAAQTALAEEERWRDAERQQALRREQAQTQLQAARSAWSVWQHAGARRIDERLALLERLWRSGELTTGDYLIQSHRYIESQETGVSLRGRVWQAWIDWLAASARLTDLLPPKPSAATQN